MKKGTEKALQETIKYIRTCLGVKDYPFDFTATDLLIIIGFLEFKLKENEDKKKSKINIKKIL